MQKEMTDNEAECPLCELVAEKVEEVFCTLIEKKVPKQECMRLMEMRRKGKIGYEQLIANLKLPELDFDKSLEKALRIVGQEIDRLKKEMGT